MAIVVVAVSCAALLGVGASTGYGAMVVQLTALGAAAGSIIPVIMATPGRVRQAGRSG